MSETDDRLVAEADLIRVTAERDEALDQLADAMVALRGALVERDAVYREAERLRTYLAHAASEARALATTADTAAQHRTPGES